MAVDVAVGRRERRAPRGLGVFREVALQPAGLIALLIVTALILVALLAPVIAPYNPNAIDVTSLLQGPSSAHWLGTDYVGRDLLSRTIYGTRTALVIALPAVVIGFVPGVLIGLSAGYLGGATDKLAIVILDTILAFPSIILAFVLLALFGSSIRSVTLIIAIAFIPSYGRLARAQTLAAKENLYVKVERSLGASNTRIVLRHILPNIIPPLLVLMALDIPGAIGTEAGLAFLGIGVQPPTADWGVMLNQGFIYVRTSPWGVLAPLIGLLLATAAFIMLGETLRDVLDPKLQGAGGRRMLGLRRG
jgi:peptide/nickel transport system permease protein